MKGVWFYEREEYGEHPAGITVSKDEELPEGDFGLEEYQWGSISLWFVDSDDFTADERQSAYRAFRERNDLTTDTDSAGGGG